MLAHPGSRPVHYSSLARGPASQSCGQPVGAPLCHCLGLILGPILVLLPSMPLALMVTDWLIKAINQPPKKFACCLEVFLPLSSIQCQRPASLGCCGSQAWSENRNCCESFLLLQPRSPLVSSDSGTSRSPSLQCSPGQNRP